MRLLERKPDAPYHVYAVLKGEIHAVRQHLSKEGYDVEESSIGLDGVEIANICKCIKGEDGVTHVIHIDRNVEGADGLKKVLEESASFVPF